MAVIARNFGTYRGLIRLSLAVVDIGLRRAKLRPPTVPEHIRRLVFVCQGNICRSAFAEVAARRHGLNAASFGLSTQTGKPAHPPAVAAAARLGYCLEEHRTTRVDDHLPQAGDLLLAMEVRQLHQLARHGELGHAPRTLLGLYTQPKCPHLHDPYSLSQDYMRVCLKRVERAIPRLRASFPNAIAAG